MMAWRNLTRPQQLLLAIGVPVAALAALLISRRQRAAAAAAEPAPAPAVEGDPTGTMPGYMPSTDAIGTGTLADWSTLITGAIADLSQQLTEQQQQGTTTPPTPTPGNPLAPSAQGAQLGKRQTTSRSVQPAGRGFPGETPSELARRVYGDRGYWNYVRFFNAAAWPGSPDKAIRAGTVIYY